MIYLQIFLKGLLYIAGLPFYALGFVVGVATAAFIQGFVVAEQLLKRL